MPQAPPVGERRGGVGGAGLPPIHIGGSGRSGTTILGRLLGCHSEHLLIPFEAKFHSHVSARGVSNT